MAEQAGIVLYNLNRREIFQATMYHSIVCAALNGGCLCGSLETVGVLTSTRLEQSFTIPPRSYSEVLPEQVLLLPQVKRALEGPRPWLKVATPLAPVEHVSRSVPVSGSTKKIGRSK